MSNEKKASDGRNYKDYAYFTSKASNCSIIYKPRVERILNSGEKALVKDENGDEMVGFRIEFKNSNLMYKKTDLNAPLISFLRDFIEKEKHVAKNKKMFIELTKPVKNIPENEVEKLLAEKDAEIASLKKASATPNKKGEKEKEPF